MAGNDVYAEWHKLLIEGRHRKGRVVDALKFQSRVFIRQSNIEISRVCEFARKSWFLNSGSTPIKLVDHDDWIRI